MVSCGQATDVVGRVLRPFAMSRHEQCYSRCCSTRENRPKKHRQRNGKTQPQTAIRSPCTMAPPPSTGTLINSGAGASISAAAARPRNQARKKANDDAAYVGQLSAGAKRQALERADGEPRQKRKRADGAAALASSSRKLAKDADMEEIDSLVSASQDPGRESS
jgi:hypothetical protein